MTEKPAARVQHQRATLAHQVEAYLLLATEREQARREAAALCARLPWLTTAQADDLADHYTEQRLRLTLQVMRTAADRAGQLRREYEARYATLRRRLLKQHAACACLVLLCTSTASAASYLLTR